MFSRRRLNIIPENKLTSLDKSREYANQESATSWSLIPFSGTEPHKDISEKVHHNSTYLSKDIVSFSQNEANRSVSNSENGSNLPSTRDTLHSEIKSESVDVKAKKPNIDSSKHTLHTVSPGPVSRHFPQTDEDKTYSKYKPEIYLHSENYRSRTHCIKASSDHHLHSERWESYKIRRKICDTSASCALRSLESRSKSVSESRILPGSVQNIAKGRYDSRASSHIRSSVITETSDKHKDRALKLADSDPSAYYPKTQLPKDAQFETSRNLSFKPQNKSIQDSEPYSITEASSAELEYSFKIPKTGPGAKMQMSPCAESTCATRFTTVSNLSEHSNFKRSRRAIIVKLSKSETKPTEVTNSDLVTNTNSKLSSEHNQSGGIKRPLESEATKETHLPDSVRQVLDDIKGKGESTEHKQKYTGTAKEQPSSGSVNEIILKKNRFPKDESNGIQNVDIAVLEEKNKAEESKEEIGSKNIKLDYKESIDKQPTMENTVQETSGNIRIKSDCPKVNERNKNVVNIKDTDQQYGGYIKFISDRKPFDTKRKNLGSFRPQYISQRYRDRSSTQITFNSHCKRRSPSELLNKDRTGRRVNNHNEMARTTRSRSRSFEDGTGIYRETKRYKITDSADGTSVRYEANKASSGSGNKSRYSRDENKKLNSSQNYKEEKGKHEVETDSLKQNRTSRQGEDSSRNIQNICSLNTNRSNSVINLRLQDDCSGQMKSMRRLNSSILTNLNEKQKSDNKVLQHELARLSTVNPSGVNEIIKTNISENNQNSFSRSNSVDLNAEITRSRSNSCERGRQVLIVAESNINSDSTDEKSVTCETYKANCKDERKKNKKPNYKSKESCTNNFHNNDNNKEGKEKNSAEVEQTKQITTKESGKEEEHNKNFQKENLLECSTKDNMMDGYSSLERLEAVTPDIVTKTQKSACMELQQHGSSKEPVTEPLACGEIIKPCGQENSSYFLSKSSSIGSVELRDRNCEAGTDVSSDSRDETCIKKTNNGHSKNGRKKSSSSHNAKGPGKNNVINVAKNKEKEISNTKEAKSGRHEECGGNVNKSLPDTNKEDSIVKSKVDSCCRNPTGSTVKGMEDVIKITVNEEKKLSGCKDSEGRSVKHLTMEQALPDNTGNSENTRNGEKEFRKNTAEWSKNSSITEEKTKKTEHKMTKKKSDSSQDYKKNNIKAGEHYETEVGKSQESMANMKLGSCTTNVQQMCLLKKNEDKRVMKAKIHDNCSGQKESTKEEVKDSVSSIINENVSSVISEKHNTGIKEPQNGSSSQPITEQSICDKGNKTGKAKKIVTRSRSRPIEEEERMLKDSTMYETSDISDGKCTRYIMPKAISETETNKYSERTEKMPNNLQKYEDRGQNTVYGTEIAQVVMDYTEGRKTETKEKSSYKESNHELFKESVIGSSVSDEVNKTRTEKGQKTKSRNKRIKGEEIIPTVLQSNEVSDNLGHRGTKCKVSDNEDKKNVSDSCENYEGNNEENRQSGFQVSQTDGNAKGSEIRRVYGNYSKTVQQMSVVDKNTEDGVVKLKLFHGCISDIKPAVDEVKDTISSAVNKNKKSYCTQFKQGSSENHVTKLSLASNENEKNRTRRMRSKSCEDGSQLIRRPQKRKMTDTVDETSVRCKTDSVESEERKKNKYSKDKNRKLSLSQKDKEIVGKKDFEVKAAQIEAGIKYSMTTRKEEEITKNVQKISLLEINNVHGITQPEIQNCSEGQIESVKGVTNVKLNEAECKEKQNGKYREPITELSVSHKVIQEGVVEIIPKSVSRDNSVELSAESSTVSPVISLKFRARRSMEHKLEDSKAILSVNITPP